ncbi:hypothetical protein NX059_006186 [Plenodomus lindquistii]|nr:hypothetical protein NX059_006186 [Plenodomus lindquistii]
MMSHTVKDWATIARTLPQFQDPECRNIIDDFELFLEGHIAPKAAASAITGVLPLLTSTADRELPRVGRVWSIFCDAVQLLAHLPEVRTRLLNLLLKIRTLELRDQDGKALCYPWGGRLWTDLPGFKLMYGDYALAVRSPEETGAENWLDQATRHLHATIFAAFALVENVGFNDWAVYVPRAMKCMCDAMDISYSPDPQLRVVMYLPPAHEWVSFAGVAIYSLCVEGATEGFSIAEWYRWKRGAENIGLNDTIHWGMTSDARMMVSDMSKIDGRRDSVITLDPVLEV